ncbi:MAG: hypothetical protein ACM3PC_02085 [Deltaproteobacteria bacterium]
MNAVPQAIPMLSREARALLTRLDRVKPFALQETAVPAAALTFAAQAALERHLAAVRGKLREAVLAYLDWLDGAGARGVAPEVVQRRFTFLRLQFNDLLSQVDIFSEALSQRSEAETGVWLSGLDAVARDALALPGLFDPPPVICHLTGGPGAAIRRARTRLPGGSENPVALVRLPRERMIGAGLASSLVHEVGHQGIALLDLLPSVRAAVQAAATPSGMKAAAWQLWPRWVSEILADQWAITKVGVTSTSGLISVVSLPRPFVFRISPDDPHPAPWIRVKLSAALGAAIHPDPQWARLARLWEALYPTERLPDQRREIFAALEASIPRLVEVLVGHRSPSLQGRTLAEAMAAQERSPDRLRAAFRRWRAGKGRISAAAPSLVFAAIGQARVDDAIEPEQEGELLAAMLKEWALQGTIDTSAICAVKTAAPQFPAAPVVRAALN